MTRRSPLDALRRWASVIRAPQGVPERAGWALALFAGHLLTVGAIGLSNVLLGLSALTTPWRSARRQLAAAEPFLLAIAAYLLLLLGSIIASHDPSTSSRASSDIFNFLVPLLAIALIRTVDQARLVIRALILIGSLIALYSLYQYTMGANHIERRASGPFSHYMTLGGFLVLVDCFLLPWMAFREGYKRWWAWLAFGLVQAALIVSYTRNAWIALLVLLVLVAFLRSPKLLLAAAPLALILVLMAPSPLLARFGSIFDPSDESNYDRLCMTYAGVNMIVDKPFLGQGPRMARERYEIYRHPTAPRQWVAHLHSSFLSLAVERGLLSLVALFALLVIPTRRALQALGRRGPPAEDTTDLSLATLFVVLVTVITGLFEDYWNDTEIQRIVLFALALPYCATRPAGDSTTDAP